MLSKSQDKSSKSSGSKFKLKHAVLGSVVLAAPVLDSVLGLTAGNSFNAVSNSTNSTESGVSIPNSSSVSYRPTYQQIMQGQIDEASKKLADAEKFAENNFRISEEDNTNNKNEPQSMVSKILSISRNLWGSISNFISGSNKDTHNHSEPQWSKDLHKSEDLEEIMDGGILGNLFSPRVDNGINTSKQQGTFIDSVELKRLTKELPLSAYPNGSPRAL